MNNHIRAYVKLAFRLKLAAELALPIEIINSLGEMLWVEAQFVEPSIFYQTADGLSLSGPMQVPFYELPKGVAYNLADAHRNNWISVNPMYNSELIPGDPDHNCMHLAYRIATNALDGIRAIKCRGNYFNREEHLQRAMHDNVMDENIQPMEKNYNYGPPIVEEDYKDGKYMGDEDVFGDKEDLY